ncbi:unnamed protein product [Alopecurus aequalis]
MASLPTLDPHQLWVMRQVLASLPPGPRRGAICVRGDPSRARTSGCAVSSALPPGPRRGGASDATPVSRRCRRGKGGGEAAWVSGQGGGEAVWAELLTGGGSGHANGEAKEARVGEGFVCSLDPKDFGKPPQGSGYNLSLGIGGCSRYEEGPGEATLGGLVEGGTLSRQCSRFDQGRGKATRGSLGEGAVSRPFSRFEEGRGKATAGCLEEGAVSRPSSRFEEGRGEATPAGLGEGTLSRQCSVQGESHGKATPGYSPVLLGDRLILHDGFAVSPDEFTSLLASNIDCVSYVLLDSLLWDTQDLQKLFSLLDRKDLNEPVVVNLSWPKKLVEFPIEKLEGSKVEIMRICFFRIPEPFFSRLAENLVVFDISHCTVDTQHFYEFIIMCTKLKELHIGFHRSNVKLRSESINVIQIWMSNMDLVDIEHAPALNNLVTSASPKEARKLLRVQVRHSPALKAIICNIANQVIVINGVDIRMENKIPCSCLREMHVGVQFTVAMQRRYLLCSLKCLTQLERLIIWRMDELSPTEDSLSALEDWSQQLGVTPCLQNLRMFTLEGYKGGELEDSLACAVLEHSSSVQYLTLEFDINLQRDLLRKVKKKICMVNQKFPHQVSIQIRKAEISGV